MNKKHLTPRDYGFLLLGSIATAIIGLIPILSIDTERRKWAVVNWLLEKSAQIHAVEMKTGTKLVTNTGVPGSIWVIFENGHSTDSAISEIAVLLAQLRCPFGISRVSGDR